MRTTVDFPDALFRKTKAEAALRGSSLKDLIIRAIERELSQQKAAQTAKRRRALFPPIPARGGKRIDWSDLDFDDLLA